MESASAGSTRSIGPRRLRDTCRMVAAAIRLLLCAGLGLLAALLSCGVRYGWPAAVWAGLCLLVLGHPALLAVEFALAWRANRRVGGPRDPLGSTFRAWIGEWGASTIAFGWRMAWRSNAFADHLPNGARGLRGVVLVHGYLCNRGVWNAWLARLTELGRAFVAVDLEPVFGDIDGHADAIGRAVRRVEEVTGLAPIVVAHSMGGVAVRAWLRTQHRPAARVARVITIASPHHGTRLARLATSRSARQMRDDGPWLMGLGAAMTAELAATFTCWWSACDQIVYPAPTAELRGGEGRRIRGVAHLALIGREEIWSELRRRLDR
ncbi:MAG: permease [Burkholderiaceae bacterium]